MERPSTDDQGVKAEVQRQLEEAKTFAKSLSIKETESGLWFLKLLSQVTRAYDRNARAAYFQKKYPGMPPDQIADKLVSVATRYAAISGGVAGAAASVGIIGAVPSAGTGLAIFAGSLGAEMLTLTGLQLRLILDLAVAYDLELDPEDPEDMLMVFGYALGVSPADLLGVRIAWGAGNLAKGSIKKNVSKETLKAVQKVGQRLGIKILQRNLIKFAVPVVSAGAGSAYNYATTKSLGEIAKRHLKNRGKVTNELRAAVSRRHSYDLAVPAAVMFMASSDGNIASKEMELYKAMLTRMSFDDHEPEDFLLLVRDKDSILEAVARIEDRDTLVALIELLTLMAIYDGALVPEERDWLLCVGERACVPVDLDEVERRAREYQIIVQESTVAKAIDIAGMAAEQTKARLKTLFGKEGVRRPSEAG